MCREYIDACRPYRHLSTSLRVKHFAERCIEKGYITLFLYNRCAGVVIAKEMAMRFMQMIEIHEGKAQSRQENYTAEDPYTYVIPRSFQAQATESVNDQLVWKAMFSVLGYLVEYNDPADQQDTVEDGLNKLFALNIDVSMFACECEMRSRASTAPDSTTV